MKPLKRSSFAIVVALAAYILLPLLVFDFALDCAIMCLAWELHDLAESQMGDFREVAPATL